MLRGNKKWSSDRPPGNICGTVATHIWDSNCQRSFFCACSGSQVMIMSRNVGFSWLHRVNVTTGSPDFFSTGNASINRKGCPGIALIKIGKWTGSPLDVCPGWDDK